MQSTKKITNTFAGMIKIGAIGYALILVCVTVSNLTLLDPNWPFSLFASFSQTLIFLLPVVIVTLLFFWRRAIIPIAVLAGIAFFPFFTFNKFVGPTDKSCKATNCISVIAANLRHNKEALARLAQSEAKDADILIIVELPYRTTSEELSALFPMGGQGLVGLITDPNVQLGSRLAVISRKPLNEMKLELVEFPKSKLRPRGIVRFDYVPSSGKPLSFVAVHPPPPKNRAATASRDVYLRTAGENLSNHSDFIMIGDFNMTPWESAFHELPGKRAGNPRWIRTWNARKFWQRITIDHALVGNGVSIVEAGVLPDVGSDHFPISLVVQTTDGSGQ